MKNNSNGRIKKRLLGETTQTTALTIIGRIKIGERHPDKGYPMSLDYFKAVSENKQYLDMVRAEYGDKPKSLRIVFTSDNFSEVCNQYYEIRDSSGKTYARGDGSTFEVALNQNGKISMHTFTEDKIIESKGSVEAFMSSIARMLNKNYKGKEPIEWKERLTLRFMVVGVPVVGLWELSTGGKDSTIPSIIASIDDIYQKSGGRLRDIPFDLLVKKHKSDKSGDSKQYTVVNIACNYSPDNLREVAMLPTSGPYTGLLTVERLNELKLQQSNNNLMLNPDIDDIDHEEI